MHRRRLLLGLVLTGAVALAAAVSASGSPRPIRVTLWGSLDASGNPVVSTASWEVAVTRMRWSLCPGAGRPCRAIPAHDGEVHTGPQPAGAVFKLTGRYHTQVATGSLTWQGPLHATSGPTLRGQARVAAQVSVRAGNWVGGWGPEGEELGIEACRTARGSRCVMLAGEELDCSRSGVCVDQGGQANTPPDDHVRIDPGYSGWYLFGLDAHILRPFHNLNVFTEQEIPPWRLSRAVVRSAPYGPLIGPPAPNVTIFPRARIDGRHVNFASISCTVRCKVNLTVNGIPAAPAEWGSSPVIVGSATVGVVGPVPAERMSVLVVVGDGPWHTGISRVIGPAPWQDLSAEDLAVAASENAGVVAATHDGSYATVTRRRISEASEPALPLGPGDGGWLSAASGTQLAYTVTATSPTGRRFTIHQEVNRIPAPTCAPDGGACVRGRWRLPSPE